MQAKTNNFLNEIIRLKKRDISQFRKTKSKFLKIFSENKNIKLIAEIKYASPTKPHLGSSKDLLKRAKQYEEFGANAISIITEKHFFKGDESFVIKVKKNVRLPVLQKDFVIDPIQIYKAKEVGSDALLLIARLVDREKLKLFVELCFELKIEPVVEIANEVDLEKAIATKTNIIADNARDLETFEVDVEKACTLVKNVPNRFIKLGFSGIHSSLEIDKYQHAGAKGVLVGTRLMQTKNIKKFMIDLINQSVKVKICGIQTLEDAQQAIAAGADFLGFIFAKNSTRAIDKNNAKKIIEKVRGKVSIVGVFKNNLLEEVNALCKELDFDFVQLHGEEDPNFCQNVIRPVIKAFGLSTDFSVKETIKKFEQYNATYFLIDREKPGVGDRLSIIKAKEIAKKFPLIFAGGLSPDSIDNIIETINPYAVDVISGVKTNNKFDFEKMKRFIASAKGVKI